MIALLKSRLFQGFKNWRQSALPNHQQLVTVRWLFLRLLGLVYLIAFLSMSVQILGLIGSEGILPVAEYHQLIEQHMGSERFWLFPTLTWLIDSDAFLQILSIGGAVLSLFLILDIFTIPVLVILWIFYLSLFYSGQVFMSFQWDILLLESGFLAIFLHIAL